MLQQLLPQHLGVLLGGGWEGWGGVASLLGRCHLEVGGEQAAILQPAGSLGMGAHLHHPTTSLHPHPPHLLHLLLSSSPFPP